MKPPNVPKTKPIVDFCELYAQNEGSSETNSTTIDSARRSLFEKNRSKFFTIPYEDYQDKIEIYSRRLSAIDL